MTRMRGFTLVEVLIATVLLAMGLTLAFATITGATQAARRGEELAASNEHVRAVEGFLRRRIAGARAVAFEIDPASGLPTRFVGDAGHMRFISDLPGYIGRGGPSLHELRVERMPSGYGVRLTLGLTVVQPTGQPPVSDPTPDVLAEGVRSVRFRYRGLGEDGKPGEWTDTWSTVEQLPLLVEVQVTGADGRPWPVLTVAPRLAAAYATGAAR